MSEETKTVTQIWEAACAYIKQQSVTTYEQWFRNLTPLSVDGERILIGVSDSFYAEWVRNNYMDLLTEALEHAGCPGIIPEFEDGHIPIPQPVDTGLDDPEFISAGADSSAVTVPVSPSVAENCLAQNTFANFVVGEENRYAFSAASTAANAPGTLNPLYIYGGPGVGKTHLIQAVANDVISRNPNAVVRYTSCEGFLNDYVDSLRNKTTHEFRSRYRDVDFLLVDDVHHLGSKTALQEEFFNTFNALHNAGKQVILTSDKQPSEIPGLEARLVSRFESGVAMQITPPQFETRLAILRQEQEGQSLKLNNQVLEFIAARITSNVRPLKSALLRLTIFSTAMGKEITVDVAETVLADLLNKEAETRIISIETIQNVVAQYFDLQVRDLTGSKRPKNIADPRMMAMYLSRKLTNHSQMEIGAAFGGRNHATVIHAVHQMEERCQNDEELKRTLSVLQKQIQTEVVSKG